MTVGEFKKSLMFKQAKKVRFYDVNGVDITNKPAIILNFLEVISSSHMSDGTIDVDVQYIK
jgi:hypothetical protein